MQSEAGETGTRHKWPDRAFHWIMAVSVIVLSGSAFLPIAGIRFDWVPVHWISGLVLTAAILFHIGRIAFVHGIAEMLPGADDVREALAGFSKSAAHLSPAKYDVFQKSYHWTAAIVVLALTVTGLLMLLKIDTPFWRRDPSILTDHQWGLVYVVHGLTALAILFLIIVHIYFALLPEHRDLLRAMITGRGRKLARGRMLKRGMTHDGQD